MPGSILSSHQIPTLLEPEPLFLMNSVGSRKWCGGVLMVGSLPSSFIVSVQWPPSGVSLSSLNGCVQVQVLLQLCSTTICGQIDRMYIYTET